MLTERDIEVFVSTKVWKEVLKTLDVRRALYLNKLLEADETADMGRLAVEVKTAINELAYMTNLPQRMKQELKDAEQQPTDQPNQPNQSD